MTEQDALALIRRGDSAGLSFLIERYTGYVSTIVWNILHEVMTTQDVEEITADVFVSLWQSRQKVGIRALRPYLAAMARNAARRALRKQGRDLALEEDILPLAADGPEAALEAQEISACLQSAIEAMEPPDDEIFLRHYYYCQSTGSIAAELAISDANVRQRLHRGREKLRQMLEQGGITHAIESNFR